MYEITHGQGITRITKHGKGITKNNRLTNITKELTNATN
jgi:hypothetical protein